MQLKDYIGIVLRRWYCLAVACVLAVGFHFLYVAWQPVLFQRTAKVLIRMPRYSPWSFAPTPTPGPFYASKPTTQASIMEEQVFRMAVRLLLGEIPFESEVMIEGRRAELDGYQDLMRRKGWSDEAEAVERQMHEIQGAVTAISPLESDIASVVSITDEDALSAAFADAVAEAAYIFHTRQAQRLIAKERDSLVVELGKVQADLAATRAERESFELKHGARNVTREIELIQQEVAQLGSRELGLQTDQRRALERMQNDIQTRLDEQARGVAVWLQGGVSNPAVGTLRGKLKDLQTQRVKLMRGSHGVTEKHHNVQDLDLETSILREQLDEEMTREIYLRGAQFSGEVKASLRQQALSRVEMDIVADRLDVLKKRLSELSAIQSDYQAAEQRFTDQTTMLKDLTSRRSALDSALVRTEGPIVVFAPVRDLRRGERAAPLPKNADRSGHYILSLALGLILGLGTAYLLEYIDDHVRTEYDVRRHLNIPILGVVPRSTGEIILSRLPAKSPIFEEFNTVATLVRARGGADGPMRSLLICSTNPREGKTTISINLAIAFARKGLKTILVDGDLRIPQVHNALGVSNQQGFATAIEHLSRAITTAGDSDALRVLEQSLQETAVPNLRVLTSGPVPTDPVMIIESPYMVRLIGELNSLADMIVFDSPPISKIGDALTLSSLVDGVVFVVGAGLSEHHELTWCKHLLRNVEANTLGVVLNMAQKRRKQEYYYYYSQDVKSLRTSR